MIKMVKIIVKKHGVLGKKEYASNSGVKKYTNTADIN